DHTTGSTAATVLTDGGVWQRFPETDQAGGNTVEQARAVTSSLAHADGPQHPPAPDGSQSGVLMGVRLTGVEPETGRPREFLSSDVRITPLVHDGRTVGATFWPGDEAVRDQNWVSGEAARAPRQAGMFFLSGPSTRGPAAVWLGDGSMVALDGANLARLVHDVRFIRSAVNTDQLAAFGLLMSEAAHRRGTLAADFQTTLVTEFGYRQPVHAPSRELTRTALDGARTPDGGPWRELRVSPVIGDVVLRGVHRTFGLPVTFRSSDALVAPLERGGSVIGATFLTGNGREFDQFWARRDQVGVTFIERAADDPRGPGDADALPTPWPRNSFHIAAHGRPDRTVVEVNLANGTQLLVDGTNFGRLVNDLAFFNTAVRRNQPEAIAMLVCFGGRGFAHDFQAAMARQFGHTLPVHAATETVFGHLFADGRSGTAVANGGVWRRFPNPPASLAAGTVLSTQEAPVTLSRTDEQPRALDEEQSLAHGGEAAPPELPSLLDGLSLGSTTETVRSLVLQAIHSYVADFFGSNRPVLAALTGQPGQGDPGEELERLLAEWLERDASPAREADWRRFPLPLQVPDRPEIRIVPGVTGHDPVSDSPQADDTPQSGRALSLREFLNRE
ncbi:MAG: hypothetical protein QOF58_7582, partial [Pseudonocardiales bacterium]|nr:hypothetical protein [Pseudonocardiales bacterium]